MHTITEQLMCPLRSIGRSNKLSLESILLLPWVIHPHSASRLRCSLALECGFRYVMPSQPAHSKILRVLCVMLTLLEVSLLKGFDSAAEKLGGLAYDC